MNILGISAFNHDSACCLFIGGELVAAVEEERFSRIKHDSRLPMKSMQLCMQRGNVDISEIDCIAYFEETEKKVARQIWSAIASPKVRQRLNVEPNFPIDEIRRRMGYDGKIISISHHESHAASAYFMSGAEQCAIICADGVGEWATTSYWSGEPNGLRLLQEVEFPHSIGLFYAAITGFLGFNVNCDEYKVMGLAPYGKPKYVKELRQLIELSDDGNLKLGLQYFDFFAGERMYSPLLESLLGIRARSATEPLGPEHSDIAHSAQFVLEEIMLAAARHIRRQLPNCETLCLTGGVALNCVSNRRIREESGFTNVFFQPASGDSGSCIGAAYLATKMLYPAQIVKTGLDNLFLGPEYNEREIGLLLDRLGITTRPMSYEKCAQVVAQYLAEGKILGHFRGRAEFGPRALGARSILADPRAETIRDRVNQSVKQRETFRPFAPAVMEEHMADYFQFSTTSAFMTETCAVLPGASLPAVTHVDGSARIQTVDHTDNSHPLAAVLREFYRITNCPVLLNTSFNLRGEPIVNTIEDAIRTFIHSDLDALVLENFILLRLDIPEQLHSINRPGFTEQDLDARSTVYSFF